MPIISLLKPEIKEWLEKSIESELYAHHLYIHIANQLQRLGYFGTQKYFESESADELKHFYIIRDYMNDMGDVAIIPLMKPPVEIITSISMALNLAYQTELSLMRQYQDFYEAAEEEDCITGQFLLQFLEIQRKSVGEFGDFISRLEKNPTDVFEFDEFMEEQIQ